MRFKYIYKKALRYIGNQFAKYFIIGLLFTQGIITTLHAQVDSLTQPSWWFGVAGGVNANFYRGTTQELNSELTIPAGFRHGSGAGLYLAPHVEYHNPNSVWGVMLQASYDNRSGKFDQIKTPCNCPADLNTNLGYITIEPSLRVAPFKNGFFMFAGPRLAYTINKSFNYKLGINPDYPEQVPTPEVKGDFSKINKWQLSMQIGAGYDIPLSSKNRQTQFVLSPFISYHPYFGQTPRSIETWNVNTLRAGVALKFGRGHRTVVTDKTILEAPAAEPEVRFFVYAPKNIPSERRMRETFPIRNYVFFDIGSTEIPERYVLLSKDQVKDFKENQLEVFKPKRLAGRSNREMVVYYNILNILGDRLSKNKNTNIRLTGSTMSGPENGLAMAYSVKKYLVNVFGIDSSRIKTDGRVKPRILSEKPGSTIDVDLLREGDNRVTIWSESPELLMEFQTGNDVPLKPVELVSDMEAPFDSYVTFAAFGAKAALSSWSLEIKDNKGKIHNFGPYTQEKLNLPGKSIMGVNPSGDYKVTMIGKKLTGGILKKDTTLHMVLWTPSKSEMGVRYSVIYEFDESKAIQLYDKYLAEIVTPQIPKNGTVIIQGYTDIVGDEAYNVELSLARANDVKSIIEKGLKKAGRTDVIFQVHGLGEDESLSPFENKYPEERFYNRTVIIDIIPEK
jgi:outer membrane protein OmpA-like peptidoglycan-associated protein